MLEASSATHPFSFDELSVAYRYSLLNFTLNNELLPTHPPGHSVTATPLPRIFLRLDCAYTFDHFLAALSRRSDKWDITYDDPTSCVAWIDEYETLDWSSILSPPYRIASSFCVRKGLGRKAVMATLLEAHVLRCGSLCALSGHALPHTIVIDTFAAIHARPKWLDFKSALAEALSEADDALSTGGQWILKPSMTNKGAGIALVKNSIELRDALEEAEDAGTFVLQRYLSNPFLINPSSIGGGGGSGGGNKFHIRVYVLAIGALEVHVFKEALVLFAPRPYSNAPTSDVAAHLTNSCLGATAIEWNDDIHVRALSELPTLIGEDNNGLEITRKAFEQITRIIGHTFASLEGNVAAFLPAPACFELYGVDFLLDDVGNILLLEFNPSPDIKQTGTRLNNVIERMIAGLVSLVFDAPRMIQADVKKSVAENYLRITPPSISGQAYIPLSSSVDIMTMPRIPLCGVDSLGISLKAGQSWLPGSSGSIFNGLSKNAVKTAQENKGTGWECVYAKKSKNTENMNVNVS